MSRPSVTDTTTPSADHALGQLLAGLRRSGALKDTVIVFLSDHDEGWGAHQIFGHSTQHFEEIIEIPLLLRLPNAISGGTVDARRVSTVGVAPTLLAALGLPTDQDYQGSSLLDPTYRPRLHFAWSNNVGPIASLIVDTWKLIWIPSSDERWLFNLRDDAAERHNLAGQAASRDREVACTCSSGVAEPNCAMRRRYRALRRVRDVVANTRRPPDR